MSRALYARKILAQNLTSHTIMALLSLTSLTLYHTEKRRFLHNMEKLCNLSEVLWRKHGKCNYQNGYYGECMETMLRVILFMEMLW